MINYRPNGATSLMDDPNHVWFTGAKIKISLDGTYSEELTDGSQKKLEKASITLADCLACSGCITSAESVLIEQQSSAELMR